MKTKQQTLFLLAALPEDSPVWRDLHDDARLLSGIAKAEADVREDRERPIADARQALEQRWLQRRSHSA
jgi:hypothetical protein